MNPPNFLLCYVDRPQEAGEFYHRLFGAPIIEASPNWAMVALPGGLMLGLWGRHDVTPVPAAGTVGFELGVTVDSDAAVDQALAEAVALGCRVLQPPVRLDFGYTFLVATPEGHSLRAFHPGD